MPPDATEPPPADTEVLLDDVTFPEAPRWQPGGGRQETGRGAGGGRHETGRGAGGGRHQDGRLWFSDFFAHVVRTVDLDGAAEVVAHVPTQPSGLGWLPDGRLLVVSMVDRRVLRQEADGTLALHADLAATAPFHANDLLVDPQGRAYVGNFGSDIGAGEPLRPTVLHLVHPDGSVEVAAEGLAFPNGMALADDGATLLVCETLASRVTAFAVDPATGHLDGRRTWAELPGWFPDGCCLDQEGALWVAVPPANECLRVAEGGEVLDRVRTHRPAVACALGGPDGRTLFVASSAFGVHGVDEGDHLGRIEVARVDVPGA